MSDRFSDLYRFYGADGELLYIGRSAHAVTRLESHKSNKDWWAEVARMEIERFPTEQIADAERDAIARERPTYNIAGKDTTVRPPRINAASTKDYPSHLYSRAYRDRKRGGPPRTPAPCGTRAAATRHRRHGEPLCGACLEAERIYQREAARRRRKGTT